MQGKDQRGCWRLLARGQVLSRAVEPGHKVQRLSHIVSELRLCGPHVRGDTRSHPTHKSETESVSVFSVWRAGSQKGPSEGSGESWHFPP